MKKYLCVLLSILLLFGCTGFSSAAADALPESAHPYADNADEEQTYCFPEETDGFFMTFSADTHFEEPAVVFYGEDGSVLDLDLDTVLEMDFDEFEKLVYDLEFKDGDSLTLYNGEGFIGSYTGDELAGRTVYVPGGDVTLELITDESVSDFGYKVESVSAAAPEGIRTVTYHLADGKSTYINCFTEGEEDYVLSCEGMLYEDKAYIGWSDAEGGELLYSGYEDLIIDRDLDFYPVFTANLLRPDEVFSFDNEYEPFAVNDYSYAIDEENSLSFTNYYMNNEDYTAMLKNLYRAGAVSPLFIPAAIAAGDLMLYPLSYWGGSCYGMALTAALQHYGLLDLLKYGENAQTVSDLAPTSELISCINYYQAQEFAGSLMDTTADYPGTTMYRVKLKKLYNEVAGGRIALFGFYENHTFDSGGHAVLLTGAYDDADGNHVLLSYDCNFGSMYTESYATRYIISPDYSYMVSEYYGDIIGFDWVSDFSGFETFDISGNGNITSWYKSIFNHIMDFFRMIGDFFRTLFRIK